MQPILPLPCCDEQTPAGLQGRADLSRRRWIVALLNLALYVGLCLWLASILGIGGWSLIDAGFFASFLIGAPWVVLGCVNALIGLWLLQFAKDGLRATAPFLEAGRQDCRLAERIAIIMTLRNEDAARAFVRLRATANELQASNQAHAFAYHVLSDTNHPAIAEDEERLIAEWRAESPNLAPKIHYRRRGANTGFKAGNVREFCTEFANAYDCFIPLDADSRMGGDAIIMMARIAQAYPKIGILQSLAVGAPSASAFARLFQFGMRAGMRSYTMGAAWWTGDCGPFWGHNGLVRLQPFLHACALPVSPGKAPFGGPILSHDQVEAAFMRRAGFEVRVIPIESQSFEDNPPDIVAFSGRDMRWCQGNMQYGPLIGLPGLQPVSRFQLLWAMTMFAGLPGGFLMLLLAALKPFDGEPPDVFPVGSAIAFYCAFLLMGLAPKLCGLADVVLGRSIQRYGGGRLFAASALIEIIGSYALSAAVGFRTSLFLARLPFGAGRGWASQRRDAGALSWRDAFLAFWPATLFGLFICGLLWAKAPSALWFAAPFAIGLVFAIPFAKWTASPALGRFFVSRRLCAAPEEFLTPQNPS